MVAIQQYIHEVAAQGRHHFTTPEAQTALGLSQKAAQLALLRLEKQGLVAHPARGLWLIVPPEYARLECLPAEQFVPALMEHVGRPYYVGLLSAAQFHGAAHHRPQVFQVMTAVNRRPLECGRVRVQFVARKRVAQVSTQPFNTPRGTIRVSTVEATAIDLAGYMHHCGGIDNVATVLAELGEQLDSDRLAAAARVAPIPWAQRLGYLLETVGHGEKIGALRTYVRQAARNSVPLSPETTDRSGPRNAVWRLILNTPVEAER